MMYWSSDATRSDRDQGVYGWNCRMVVSVRARPGSGTGPSGEFIVVTESAGCLVIDWEMRKGGRRVIDPC